MEFSDKECLAVIRVLEKIAKADNQIREEEMQVLLSAVRYLNKNEDSIQQSKDMPLAKAGRLLTKMNLTKRLFVKTTILKLVASDGVVDLNQLRTILDTFLAIDEDS